MRRESTERNALRRTASPRSGIEQVMESQLMARYRLTEESPTITVTVNLEPQIIGQARHMRQHRQDATTSDHRYTWLSGSHMNVA